MSHKWVERIRQQETLLEQQLIFEAFENGGRRLPGRATI